MKMHKNILIALIVLALPLMLVACDTETGEVDVNEVRTERMVDEWKQDLESVGQEIENLAEKSKENAEEGTDEMVAKLRDMRDNLKEKIDNAGDESAEAWDDVKRGIESGWKDLKGAVADAKQKLDPEG